MVEFKVMAYADREKMVMALVNSGYSVKVEERPEPKRYMSKEYFVIIEDVNSIQFNINIQGADSYVANDKMAKEILQKISGFKAQASI